MKKCLVCGVAASAVALAAGTASAGVIFGTDSNGSTGDIYSGGGITNGSFDFDGGEGVLLCSSLVDDSVMTDSDGSGPWNRGVASSHATIVPNGLPKLGCLSSLTGGHSTIDNFGDLPVGASSFARSGALAPYQYVGNAPMTLAITYSLEAEVFIAGNDVSGLTGAYAQFSVWDDQLTFFATDDGSLGEGGGSRLSHNGVDAEGTMYIDFETNGLAIITVTALFDVQPGQIFHVCAEMGTAALYGTSFADASNTFEGSFDHPELVRSLVPAPGVASVGLLAAAAGLRRRRS